MNAICPGCGWRGEVKPKLACPECGWENNLPPWRLLTLEEMQKDSDGVYGDINMSRFLSAVVLEFNATAHRASGAAVSCKDVSGTK